MTTLSAEKETVVVASLPRSAWPKWYCQIHKTPIKDQGYVLVCPGGECFPCIEGIPRFIRSTRYTDAFGIQWNRYRRTQLDSYTDSTISRDRAARCIGEELWRQLEGKQVLECGCGAGRFTEVLLGNGAYVTSIDLSDAVDANQENFPQNGSHRIAQADVLQLPFAPRQFDVVFCLGVIQHTPNPEQTINCLYDQVRPGGTLVIDHYTYDLSWFTKTAPLVRLYLKRLPPAKGIRRTEWLVDKLLPLHQMARRFYPAQMLLSRLSPVLCYYHAFPDLPDEVHREWALLDTHDSLTAWYMHFRTRGQIQRVLERLGLIDICCNYAGNGVEARGRRPIREEL